MTTYLNDLFNDHVRFGLIGSLPHATNYAVFGHGFLGYSVGANFIKNRWKPKVVETSSLWIQLLGFFIFIFHGFDPMGFITIFYQDLGEYFCYFIQASFTSKSKTKDPGEALRLSLLKPYSLWRHLRSGLRQRFRNCFFPPCKKRTLFEREKGKLKKL